MLKVIVLALAVVPALATSSQALTCGVYGGSAQCGDFSGSSSSPTTTIVQPSPTDEGGVSTCISTGTYTFCN